MAHPSQEASSQHQGSDDHGIPYGDRDPDPAPPDPGVPAGILVTPPPRGDDDEQ